MFELPEGLSGKINAQFVVPPEEPIVKAGDRMFDYSMARNFAAKMAVNDIVQMPDCDEQFTHCDIDAINEAIKRGYQQFEFHFIFAHYPNGQPAIQFRQCKSYDRRVMHWQGIVHEVLVGSAKRTYLPPNVLLLEHFQAPQTHRTRYMAGLALDCYLNQNNDRNSHYLGREFIWNGRPRSAIKEFTRHVAMNCWQQERGQSMVFIGDAHMMLGEEEKGIESWHKAIQIDDTRREPWLRLADYYWKKNNPQRVLCYANAALEIPPSDCYCNVGAHYTFEPHERLYWAYWWFGEQFGASPQRQYYRDKSKEHWRKALEYDPSNPKYVRDKQFYEPQGYDYKLPGGGSAADGGGIDGWMTHGELDWLYHRAQKVDSIAEVGSWKGRSTHALLSGCKGKVVAVDTFKGSADPRDQTNAIAKKEDILATFRKNVGHFPNLEVCQMTSEEAAKKFSAEGRKFDMVFIDAGHAYEEVKQDILLWKDLATVILSGHDYGAKDFGPDVNRAVDECLGPTSHHETIWFKELSRAPILPLADVPRNDALVAVITCKRHAAWADACRDTWVPEVRAKGFDVEFFDGERLGVPDDYKSLPLKTKAVCKWARENKYGHMLKCDDDTFLNADALSIPQDDYAGMVLAANDLGCPALAIPDYPPHTFEHDYASGGCYWLSSKAMGIVADAPTGIDWAEDRWVGEALAKEGIKVASLPGYLYIKWGEFQEDRPAWLNPSLVAAMQLAGPEKVRMCHEGLCKPHRIPKRLFSIWLSDKEGLSPIVEKCMESQRAMRGYEHRLLTLADVPKGIPYLDAAIAAKKWVKAADCLRVWWLWRHGGIYCDSDMEILPGKDFDALLDAKFFICREDNGFVANSLIGAEKGSDICLGHMREVEGRFKGDDDKIFEAAQEILTPRVVNAAQADPSVKVLPSDYFIPYNHQNGEINVTDRTIAFHHFAKAWISYDYTRDFLPRVAVLVPTLGRPEGLARCLKSIDRLYYPKHLLKVVVDGGEGTVPEKVNRMAADNPDVDAYVYAANDMEFDPWCLYTAIREARGNPPKAHPFQTPPAYPFVYGLVSFNAGPVYPDEGNICEHFLITKELYSKMGEVFSEKFHHCGCDNLLWAKAKKFSRAMHSEAARIVHHHFSKGAPMDEVYHKGWSQVEADRAVLAEELKKLSASPS
jgi:tetratricopeptide (TPR) repeat protein